MSPALRAIDLSGNRVASVGCDQLTGSAISLYVSANCRPCCLLVFGIRSAVLVLVLTLAVCAPPAISQEHCKSSFAPSGGLCIRQYVVSTEPVSTVKTATASADCNWVACRTLRGLQLRKLWHPLPTLIKPTLLDLAEMYAQVASRRYAVSHALRKMVVSNTEIWTTTLWTRCRQWLKS